MLPRLIVLTLSGWLLLGLLAARANPVVPPGPFGPPPEESYRRHPPLPPLPALRRTVQTTLTIEVGARDSRSTTLQLPRQMLDDLQTACLPAEETPTRAGIGQGRWRTLIAGLALALALTAAGLWTIRTRGRFGMGGLCLLLLVLGAAGVSCFHFSRPETMPTAPPPLQQAGSDSLAGRAVVGLGEADGIHVNLSREELARIAEAPAPK
jgi:hypothetical protein